MSVEKVLVGDVLRLERRPVEVEVTKTYEEIGVRSFGRGIFHKEPVTGAELGSKRVFRIEPNDLVISNVFAWEGAIAVASAAEKGKIGSHRFMTWVPRDHRIDTGWAAWFFRSEPGLELIRRASPGSAGRNKTLAIDRFEALEIPLPPIQEQRWAATRLRRFQTSRLAIDPLLVKGRSSLVLFRESLLQRLFEALKKDTSRWSTLADFGTWSSGGTPKATEARYYDGQIPWAVIGDLNDGTVFNTERAITSLGLEHSSAKVVPRGTVLVAMYGSIGKLGLAGTDMATNQAIAACQPKDVSADYLMSLLRCMRSELVALGQGGAQKNISQKLLKSRIAPKPPLDRQQRFVSEVQGILGATKKISTAFQDRDRLLDSLLQAAMNQLFADLV